MIDEAGLVVGVLAHVAQGLVQGFGAVGTAKYRRRLKTTNMQERLNEEIRRRERVIRIFPNDAAALRLIGALLAEHNEAWQERKYLDMDEFADWAANRAVSADDHHIVVVSS